ncbi:Hypothetical protein NTJ_13580 [Nesidiocoris tenuis]|uniref:Uncharacterized protein n=1 Tax=Nesidiocoris tenuis TaxID=355587 RepID=A0ABN7B926_9HEMI|nr:Hypothetical protein NTJ_13580 [Nesidiocoris tenuis]
MKKSCTNEKGETENCEWEDDRGVRRRDSGERHSWHSHRSVCRPTGDLMSVTSASRLPSSAQWLLLASRG